MRQQYPEQKSNKRKTINNLIFSDDLDEKEVEIKLEISKKKGLLKKPVKFTDVGAKVDVDIAPNPDLFQFYIDTNPVNRSIQVSGMTSEHEVGRMADDAINSG